MPPQDNKLVILLGQSWQGSEYIEVTRRVKKGGYRVRAVRKTWKGGRVTLFSEEAWNAGEVISKIQENLLPIFKVPESVKEEIKAFCE